MKTFLIFVLLITYVHPPTYSFSKIKLSEGADFPVMGISHKHAPEGSPFVMELIIVSPTHGTFTVLYDEEDHDKIAPYNWSVRKVYKNFYATRNIYNKGKRNQSTKCDMHRMVMNAPKGRSVDHKDGNTINNQKSNLRVCDQKENMRNMKTPSHNKSGFKGVFFCAQKNAWTAKIQVDKKTYHGGFFDNKCQAAIVYNLLAIKLHGDFARLNILTEEENKMALIPNSKKEFINKKAI